tara:strand:- start:150 stop:344 length:195 start_codon:yes stop_codon:yes gene_type:complete
MTKIIFFILACSTCDLEYQTYPKNKNMSCGQQGNLYMKTNAVWLQEWQAYYTKDGKILIGYRCE